MRSMAGCGVRAGWVLASIFHWLGGVWAASLPVLWVGLCRLGVTACRVSSRGGRAFPGASGVLQDRGGQEMSSACLRGGECLEVPEAVKQKAGPGVVGLVAQDGAAGVVGDDGGDGHQPQADRPGLPGAGGGVGQGEQLGEGQQACGPEPRSGTRPGWPQTPARESGQARCPWRSGYGPGSGPAAGGAPRDRRADPPSCWWRRRSVGSRPRPRSAAGRPDGAALGA